MSEEWGPWIEHDGGNCPCTGMIAKWQHAAGAIHEGIANVTRDGLDTPIKTIEQGGNSSWYWHMQRDAGSRVLRYCLPVS